MIIDGYQDIIRIQVIYGQLLYCDCVSNQNRMNRLITAVSFIGS